MRIFLYYFLLLLLMCQLVCVCVCVCVFAVYRIAAVTVEPILLLSLFLLLQQCCTVGLCVSVFFCKFLAFLALVLHISCFFHAFVFAFRSYYFQYEMLWRQKAAITFRCCCCCRVYCCCHCWCQHLAPLLLLLLLTVVLQPLSMLLLFEHLTYTLKVSKTHTQ